MKTFLLIVLLLAFLQSTFLPLNLVLVMLISRSLVLDEPGNLLSAFLAGLILSFLTQVNLGYWPLLFILAVKLIQLLKRIPVSFNALMVFFSSGLVISVVSLLNQLFIDQDLHILQIIFESVLVIPAFYFTRFWEERFIVKKSIKLKI